MLNPRWTHGKFRKQQQTVAVFLAALERGVITLRDDDMPLRVVKLPCSQSTHLCASAGMNLLKLTTALLAGAVTSIVIGCGGGSSSGGSSQPGPAAGETPPPSTGNGQPPPSTGDGQTPPPN